MYRKAFLSLYLHQITPSVWIICILQVMIGYNSIFHAESKYGNENLNFELFSRKKIISLTCLLHSMTLEWRGLEGHWTTSASFPDFFSKKS